MRLLALSNLYPPCQIGGYEMLCQEVMERLELRGHEFRVLTSDYRRDEADLETNIERSLRLETDVHYYAPAQVLHHTSEVRWNQERLREAVAGFRPDLIFVWGMWNLSKTLAEEAERIMPGRVAYYLANAWPIEPSLHRAYWEAEETGWKGRAFKLTGRPVAQAICADVWRLPNLKLQRAMCCSRAIQDQITDGGVPMQDPVVIYEGIDLEDFATPTARPAAPEEGLLRVAFVGTLVAHKGPHTAIQALGVLRRRNANCRIALTILGKGHPDYEAYLRDLVAAEGLTEDPFYSVVFAPPIPRSELPDFIHAHEAIVMPSIWEEPLARIMQDTLASGVSLVATPTGGTKEIIIHDENGLLFPPEDATTLAACLERLAESPSLRARLGEAGRRTAEVMFSIDQMVTGVEGVLSELAAAAS